MRAEILTVAEAAELLATTPGTLYAQRHRCQEPGCLGFTTTGRKVVFRRRDLEAWLDRRQSAARADLARRLTRRNPTRNRGGASHT